MPAKAVSYAAFADVRVQRPPRPLESRAVRASYRSTTPPRFPRDRPGSQCIFQREIRTNARPDGPKHGTGPLAVPLGLCRTAVSAQYRIAARCSTLKPVRLRIAYLEIAFIQGAGPPRISRSKVNMYRSRSRSSAYRAFHAANLIAPLPPDEVAENVPSTAQNRPSLTQAVELATLPLVPYQRCTCGSCRECHDNAKWDRIFAKFEVNDTEVRGLYGCALVDL